MAQYKKITFIGRLDKDTGVSECIKFAKKNSLELRFVGDGPLKNELNKKYQVTGFINNPVKTLKKNDLVFATGYLAILECWSAGIHVVCGFNNPVKKDYLHLFPMSKYLLFEKMPEKEKLDENAIKYAQSMTWDNVAIQYLDLWTK